MGSLLSAEVHWNFSWRSARCAIMLCLLVNTRFSYLVDIRCKSKNLSAGDHVKQVIHCSQQTLHESFCGPWLAGLVITVQHLNSNDQIILMKSISSSKIIPNHTFHVRILGTAPVEARPFSCCRMYSSTCQCGRMLAIKKAHFCNFHVQKRQESPCAGSRLSLQAIKGSNIGMYFSLLQLEEGPQRMNGTHTLKNTERSFKVEYFIRIICSNLGKLRNLKRSRHLQKWCTCQWSTSPWQPLGFCTTTNC